MKRIAVLVFCFLLIGMCGNDVRAFASFSDQVRETLRKRVEAVDIALEKTIGREPLYAAPVLSGFYEGRTYRAAWSDANGPLAQVDSLIESLIEAEAEGLWPADYHLNAIRKMLNQIRNDETQEKPFDVDRLVDLDLILTDAFMTYASHLIGGTVNPETIDKEWHVTRRQKNLVQALEAGLKTDRLAEALGEFLPTDPGYARLKQALQIHRRILEKGGWPKVPIGAKLQKDDRSERVKLLRTRLRASGDLTQKPVQDADFFDESLMLAVQGFQRRHGLEDDGVVGPSTLAALNVSVKARTRQIALNLERWRWLPQDLGKRHILVNIADFGLDVIENGNSVMQMRVVVGRPYRHTPVFSGKITYLVLNPSWQVPPSIAVKDKLPMIRKDPQYLNKQHMRVYRGWGADAREIDPQTVDWATVTAKSFAYRLYQDPGPWNALGQVKFMFPNKFNVYLHSTPERNLFDRTRRSFSSGCIRIEKPIQLAEYLLNGDPRWSHEKIMAAIEKNAEQTASLKDPMPVHILYWTAWVQADGTVQFRDDIYGRDRLLGTVLRETVSQ